MITNNTWRRYSTKSLWVAFKAAIKIGARCWWKLHTLFFLIACLNVLLMGGEASSAQNVHNEAWPDPLVFQDGSAVRNLSDFQFRRRSEILRLFEENVYGRTPSTTLPVRVVRTDVDPRALHGVARRIQITLAIGPNAERTWHLLQYMPANARGPVPVFI